MKKAALITGGARRIGRSIAENLSEAGFDIALHYNSSGEEARILREEIVKKGVKCELFRCNLENEKEVTGLMPGVMKKFPYLCMVINNASIFNRANLLGTDTELFNRTMNINLKSPYILTRDFARLIKKGQIINIIDTKIAFNDSNYFAYLISKKALKDMTLLSAEELGPDIRVNGICPGLILEPEGKTEEYMRDLAKNIPLRRKGNIENIIEAIHFLINNEYITGQLIYIDGGQHLCRR